MCLFALFLRECNCVHSGYLDSDSNRDLHPQCVLNRQVVEDGGEEPQDNFECVVKVHEALDQEERGCNCRWDIISVLLISY